MCEGRGTLVTLNKRNWTLLGGYSIMHVLSCFDVDPTEILLALACGYKINFDTEHDLGWSPYNFDDSVVS